MDENPHTDHPNAELLDDITDTEQQLLHIVEDLAVAGTLTEGDRDQIGFEIGVLSAELRACIDPSRWE
ncbi:hypothetical protein [Halomarina litorea]|uniref:hypothetical protein n=1 Tax=Halomarina litorea TaxID=2961595 RepID=UPI0020C41A09|nr:hypothetical protein [Halomarina sp. BCD28]